MFPFTYLFVLAEREKPQRCRGQFGAFAAERAQRGDLADFDHFGPPEQYWKGPLDWEMGLLVGAWILYITLWAKRPWTISECLPL